MRAVDEELVIFEPIFVYDDVGGEDGGFDVFDELDVGEHYYCWFCAADFFDGFERVHAADPVDNGIDFAVEEVLASDSTAVGPDFCFPDGVVDGCAGEDDVDVEIC